MLFPTCKKGILSRFIFKKKGTSDSFYRVEIFFCKIDFLQLKSTIHMTVLLSRDSIASAKLKRMVALLQLPVFSVVLFLQSGHQCLVRVSQTSTSGCENSSSFPQSVVGIGF